ncbi:hypothetical protein BXT86_05355 [candidate division WOR-3 bacterium 4484_100]|uniref:Uncharacterized protein n=1 Tax=candidate division WOR-3 bacterium 4484_100 TaxID=1936077 RepID=A0A1V4QE90_UNCW3|nr:MAG: hypothetical protein BXT86_05355 [candidate division WOR-3 bacterium 4484_100]
MSHWKIDSHYVINPHYSYSAGREESPSAKIPLDPPLEKGEVVIPLLWKRRDGEDFKINA